jgi:hypothetical protein
MGFFSLELSDDIINNSYFGLFGALGIKKELRHLSDILKQGEKVLAVTKGQVDSRTWLLAVTDARLILLNFGLLFTRRQLEVPLFSVKSVGYAKGLIYSSISIDTGGGIVSLEKMQKKSITALTTIICNAVNDTVNKNSSSEKTDDLTRELERLANLKERGNLSNIEFEAQKRRLLAKTPKTLSVVKEAPVPNKPAVKPQAPQTPKAPKTPTEAQRS